MIKNVNQQHREKLSILDKFAIAITSFVGTVYCAILFAILAFIGLPDAIAEGRPGIISWITQTFLQLVLLSIIMAGQNIQNRKDELRAEADYNTNVESKKDIEELNKKLDVILEKLEK